MQQSILASGQMSKGKAKPRTVFLVQALDEVLDLGEKWQETLGVFETLASAKREAWKKMSMQQQGPAEEQQEEEGSGDDYDEGAGISRRVDDGPQKRQRSKTKEQEKKKKREKEKILPRGWKKDEDGELHWLYEVRFCCNADGLL